MTTSTVDYTPTGMGFRADFLPNKGGTRTHSEDCCLWKDLVEISFPQTHS